jgi:hypothetical protein
MKKIIIIFFTSITFFLLSSKIINPELVVKTIYNNKIEIKLPNDFKIMSEELARLKYPSERRPTIIYTNESGGINIAFNITESEINQDKIEFFTEELHKYFKNLYPSADWKNYGVKVINKRKIGYLELVTPAIDTEIYNLIFFTNLDGKLVLCTFNCTKKNMSEWEIIAKEIMNSFKVI